MFFISNRQAKRTACFYGCTELLAIDIRYSSLFSKWEFFDANHENLLIQKMFRLYYGKKNLCGPWPSPYLTFGEEKFTKKNYEWWAAKVAQAGCCKNITVVFQLQKKTNRFKKKGFRQ